MMHCTHPATAIASHAILAHQAVETRADSGMHCLSLPPGKQQVMIDILKV